MLHDPKEETGTSVTQAIVMNEAARADTKKVKKVLRNVSSFLSSVGSQTNENENPWRRDEIPKFVFRTNSSGFTRI